MSNIVMSYEGWKNKLRSDLDAVEKQAAALKATDPADNGKMDVPSYNTEAVRSNMNLPKNPTSNTVQDKDGTHGLCTVTKPNAVGEGEYPTAIDGNARDEAFKTPSTPLSKIAGDVINANGVRDNFEIPADLRSDASIMQKLAFCGNLVLGDEQGQRMVAEIMAKEAGRHEALQILESVYADLHKEAAAQEELNKQAGMEELLAPWKGKGAAILNAIKTNGQGMLDSAWNGGAEALSSLGEAGKGMLDSAWNGGAAILGQLGDAGQQYGGMALDWLKGSTPIGGVNVPNWLLASAATAGTGAAAYGTKKLLEKPASVREDQCAMAHSEWLNALQTDIEKRAYMQGAMDAAAADAAAEDPALAALMGGEIPANDADITDEEVMQVIQSMVENGEITPEQVDALMQLISGDDAPAYTAEQLAAELQAAVESGAVDPQTAEAIAASILEDIQSGALPTGDAAGMDPAAAGMDPTMAPTEADLAMEVQASLHKSASILASLD